MDQVQLGQYLAQHRFCVAANFQTIDADDGGTLVSDELVWELSGRIGFGLALGSGERVRR